jgi:phage virion morphogenesis protein
MAGVGIEIRLDTKDMEEVFLRLQAAMDDMTEPMDAIGAGLDSSMLSRFEHETSPDGVRWTPSQRALLTGGQTLTHRGHLRASGTHIASRHSVMQGSNLVYAHAQHAGGKVGRGRKVTLPARPFVGVDGDDRIMIHDTIQDFLEEAVR